MQLGNNKKLNQSTVIKIKKRNYTEACISLMISLITSNNYDIEDHCDVNEDQSREEGHSKNSQDINFDRLKYANR